MMQKELFDKEFDKPGRGRKRCKCGAVVVGARTKVCSVCGHTLIKKAKRAKSTKPKPPKDPIYVAMDRIRKETPPLYSLFKDIDPGEKQSDGTTFDYTTRVGKMYNKRLEEFREWEKQVRHKAYVEILQGITWENSPYEWEEIAAKIDFSMEQARQPSAGEAVRDFFCYFLDVAGIPYREEVLVVKTKSRSKKRDRVDVVIGGRFSTSCKHTMRDRENDREHPIHVMQKAEASDEIWRFFKKIKAIVIILNSESRNDKMKSNKQKGIKLPLLSLDEGIKKIKEMLLEAREHNTNTQTDRLDICDTRSEAGEASDALVSRSNAFGVCG